MEEQEIANKCRRKDREAQQELYEKFGEYLFRICLRYMKQRSDAEDMLQESFLKIFDVIGKFKWLGKGSLRSWVARVTINECLQKLRKKKLLDFSESVENSKNTCDKPYESPEKENVNCIPPAVLQEMLLSLPDGYRTVFNLYVFEKKSHREIAGMLGINEKSSSSQFYRARKQLAKKIINYRKKQESV